MKVARIVIASLILGATLGFAAALLSPRRLPGQQGYRPVDGSGTLG